MFRGGKNKMARIDTLVGQHTVLRGDIHYRGGLHVDGAIKGNVIADDDPESVLSVSERGVVEGDVRVYNIILNGKVVGDVHALEKIELAANARVIGNVYYKLIEMAMGSEVNGNLVHKVEKPVDALTDERAMAAEIQAKS